MSTGMDVLVAAEAVDVDQLPALRETRDGLGVLAHQAGQVDITDRISAESATALLRNVVAAKRAAEAQRKELVGPLNTVVAKLNAAAKAITEPLGQIEAGLKQKITAYQREEERKAELARQELEAEVQRRRDAEAERQREIENAARIEREKAAREAQAAADAARRIADEQARQAREAASALERQIRQAPDDKLTYWAGSDASSGERSGMALAELDRRKTTREAQAAAEAAAQAEREARIAEQMAAATVNLPIVAPPVEAPAKLAGMSTSRRWTFEIIDQSRVPMRYLVLDSAKVREAIRSGERAIPGLRIYQADSASVRL